MEVVMKGALMKEKEKELGLKNGKTGENTKENRGMTRSKEKEK